MIPWLRSFFLDQATFTRVLSDLTATVGLAASLPPSQALLAGLLPGAEWAGPVAAIVAGTYSARKRQVEAPPE